MSPTSGQVNVKEYLMECTSDTGSVSTVTDSSDRTGHHVGLLAEAVVAIVEAAGATVDGPLTGPQVLDLAQQTAAEVATLRAQNQAVQNLLAKERATYNYCGPLLISGADLADIFANDGGGHHRNPTDTPSGSRPGQS